jgi:hypothetical protein
MTVILMLYVKISVVVPNWFQCGSGSRFLSQCGDPDPGAKPKRIHADPGPGQTFKSQKVELKKVICKK